MKKILSIILVITITLSFSACGNIKVFVPCKNCGEYISKGASFCEHCSVSTNKEKTESKAGEISNPSSDIESTSKSTETTKPTTNSTPSSNPTSSTSKPSSTTENISRPTETSHPSTPTHTHFYSKKVIAATCTEKGYTTYTCSCGDTYNSYYVDPAHKYKKNVCTVCGAKHQNYDLYQAEYTKLTNEYNTQVSTLQVKIAESNKTIEECQDAINDARGALYSLSPYCPQWYIQEYVNNWQAFGSTAAATQAAKNAWSQEYNSQKSQLNNAIAMNTSKMQAEQQNVRLYNSAISSLTTQYNNDVSALKIKYEM